jgi:hypothetical protein
MTLPASFWAFIAGQVAVVRREAMVPPAVRLERGADAITVNKQLLGTWAIGLVGPFCLSVEHEGRWFFVPATRFFKVVR